MKRGITIRVTWQRVLVLLLIFAAVHFADSYWHVLAREGTFPGDFTLFGVGMATAMLIGVAEGLWRAWRSR